MEQENCLTLKDMAVTGRDLIEQGVVPGKKLGELLQILFEHVLEVPEDNEKEILLEILKREHLA